jgi:hypothetical protein
MPLAPRLAPKMAGHSAARLGITVTDWLCYLRPDPRLERGTYCLGGIPVTSLQGARYSLTGRSVAAIMAGCGLVWPDACGRWLPVWLPEISLTTLNFGYSEQRRADWILRLLAAAVPLRPGASIQGPVKIMQRSGSPAL